MAEPKLAIEQRVNRLEYAVAIMARWILEETLGTSDKEELEEILQFRRDNLEKEKNERVESSSDNSDPERQEES